MNRKISAVAAVLSEFCLTNRAVRLESFCSVLLYLLTQTVTLPHTATWLLIGSEHRAASGR